MKLTVYILLGLLIFTGQSVAADQSRALKTEKQKLSYALGLDLGAYFKSLGEDFDLVKVQRGIEDAYQGKKTLLTPEEAAQVQQQFAARQQEKQVKKVLEMTAANKKAAKKFLDENKAKEGVITTTSGLQYKVIKKGTGRQPTAKDTVKVHYKGSLLNGTEFDSSYKRNQPLEFAVDQVIPGWGEALQLMHVGGTYMLYVPPELAYGDRGFPPTIEPGSLLIFKVELLDILDKNSGKSTVDKGKDASKN